MLLGRKSRTLSHKHVLWVRHFYLQPIFPAFHPQSLPDQRYAYSRLHMRPHPFILCMLYHRLIPALNNRIFQTKIGAKNPTIVDRDASGMRCHFVPNLVLVIYGQLSTMKVLNWNLKLGLISVLDCLWLEEL